MSFIWLAWVGIDVLVSVYDMQQPYCHLSTHEVYYLLNFIGYLLLLLNHVVIVVKLCVEGLMKDRCTANKHSR